MKKISIICCLIIKIILNYLLCNYQNNYQNNSKLFFVYLLKYFQIFCFVFKLFNMYVNYKIITCIVKATTIAEDLNIIN